jgi:hypothetical protein
MEEGLAEWRKYLPNKREALSSKPQYHQKEKKKRDEVSRQAKGKMCK